MHITPKIRAARTFKRFSSYVATGRISLHVDEYQSAGRVLPQLRNEEPGAWAKIYKDGYDVNGNRISVHYFQSPSGKVYDVKVKPGWSNKSSQ